MYKHVFYDSVANPERFDEDPDPYFCLDADPNFT